MLTITTKKQLIDTFRSQIKTNPRQATKALLFMYDRYQDAVDSKDGRTALRNSDISILCRLARHYKSYRIFNACQMELVMQLLQKYARQIMESSLERGLIRKEGRCYVW